MSRATALIIVIAVWAAIFLPALGSFEIKGEEGRRILPAVSMLETGDYLVPHVGGDPYFRKPPLINWLIAASFKVFGAKNEWTARLPSVLCILSVGIAFVTLARPTLGATGSLAAALIWLTNLGMLEKGRLIEIEALYVSLCALAIIFWLSGWQQRRSPWFYWLIPSIFLGLGWLAKGPTHLLFFYAVVLAIVWQRKEWRILFHPAHFIGIALMLGIFFSWAIPFLHAHDSGKVMNKWSGQFAGRVTGEFFHFGVWATALPRALGYFLPWLVFVPFIRFNKLHAEDDRKIARALCWAAAAPLVLMNLIPGAAPRYTLPVLTPFCWMLGMIFAEDAFAWSDSPGFWRRPAWRVGRVFVVLVMLFGLIGYPVMASIMRHRQKVKVVADPINQAVPPNEKLYAVDPNYQPFFFYIHSPVEYVDSLEELPAETHYFLVRPDNADGAAALQKWAPRQPRELLRKKDYRKQTVILFRVDPS